MKNSSVRLRSRLRFFYNFARPPQAGGGAHPPPAPGFKIMKNSKTPAITHGRVFHPDNQLTDRKQVTLPAANSGRRRVSHISANPIMRAMTRAHAYEGVAEK